MRKRDTGGVSRTRALARQLRKKSSIASLSADIAAGIGEIESSSDMMSKKLHHARQRIDTVKIEAHEEHRLHKTVSDTISREQEAVREAYIIVGDIGRTFASIVKSHDQIRKFVNTGGKSDRELTGTFDELVPTLASVVEITKRIRQIAERSDIAGLNSSLEAGRTGEYGTPFAVVADGVRKVSSSFMHAADGMDETISALKSGISGISEGKEEVLERLRTVRVMSKSLGSVFRELDKSISVIGEQAEGLSVDVDETGSVCDDIARCIESLRERAGYNGDSFESAQAACDKQSMCFSAAADHGDSLTSFSLELAEHQNRHAVIDDICDTAENLVETCEETAAYLDDIIAGMEHASDALKETQDIADSNCEHHEILSAKQETAAGTAEELSKNIESFRGRIADSHDVLVEMAREIAALVEKLMESGKNLDSLRMSVAGVARFGDDCADFSARMDFFAVTGTLEAVRAGEYGSGFSVFTREFEAVSDEAAKLRDDIRTLADTLDAGIAAVIDRVSDRTWEKTAETVDSLVENLGTLLDVTLQSAGDESSVILRIISGQREEIESASEKSSAITGGLESASGSLSEASQGAGQQKDTLDTILTASRKVCSLAEALYPVEEETEQQSI